MLAVASQPIHRLLAYPPFYQLQDNYLFLKEYHNTWLLYMLMRQFVCNHHYHLKVLAAANAAALAVANGGPTTGTGNNPVGPPSGDKSNDDDESDIEEDEPNVMVSDVND